MEQHFDFGAKNYWVKDYDSRKCEAKLKALAHFVTNIDGLDIHFIHARSKNPDALPMIVTHGWPGSIIEQLKIIDPLTNPTAHSGKTEDAMVSDATVDYSDREMHPALQVNLPNYASAIVTTTEIISAISSL